MDDTRDLALRMLQGCVAGRTHQIARIVSAQYDAALKPYGLTANQLTLLCMTAVMQPVRPRDMLPYLKMEQSTLSRSLDRLVKNGWLKRDTDPEDSRSHRMALTSQGTTKLAEAQAGWGEAQAWADEAMGKQGIASFTKVARQLNPLMPEAE
ncbi:MarR family winged helix-turn-helix transcriptional regulator [Aurantiacibacter sp. D1-12]|uniref:MarR family winged helix-turn-helix transcriptional regulator n=1 Tax=Aurantiacibacter sp. D1-12 TaxID=2993658 RepID=UPI00237CC2D4|nr:MarR family transcriptional regulator [Aurantiacibacter sp. D1-12]MDE1467812.1 MarR family transcriptional regulator [Aurantiacibacter sp. D1-12]